MMLGVPIIKDYEKYLGLPSFVGRQKKLALIKSRSAFGLKCKGGRRSCYLKPAKEVVIKAVVQSIPTYSMSVFRLPIGLLKDIEAII